MKLNLIKKIHILAAADEIKNTGKNNGADYHVFVEERSEAFPFKQLVRTAYRIATGKSVTNDFFQSNPFYRNFITRKFGYRIVNSRFENVPFFAIDDIEFFSNHAGQIYQQGNQKDSQTGQRIKQSIFEKTKIWAESIALEDFTFKMDLTWQQRGRFEKYSWARIFRIGDEGKKIFFTVGVDAEVEALIYKLDCYHSSAIQENILSQAQHETFKRLIEHSPAKWNSIYKDDLPDYDWETLLETTRQFIQEFTPLYEEVIAAVWDLPLAEDITTVPLRIKSIPAGITTLPEKKQRRFHGNVDYEGDAVWKKQIGDAGEQLVIDWLKKELIDAGRPELADRICKVADWNGYDILSYDADGNERYIEVKTTCGSELRPFCWTINEFNTMKNNTGNYFLYRLYNFDPDKNTADCYILQGNFEDHILLQPTTFEVYIKSNNE